METSNAIFAVMGILVGCFVFYMLKPLTYDPVEPLEEKWWGEGAPINQTTEIFPFKVQASEQELDDLKTRLENTRYFSSLEESGWKYGSRPDFMKDVVKYWLDTFSWKSQEKIINSFEHFKTDIDGISLHFIHAKPRKISPGTKVLPILLLHGWPGSFFEFYKVIPLLTEEKDGFVFEVIVPSLPGYGFSSPSRKKGMGPEYMADIMLKLMTRLGWPSFYVQGGDWGSVVARFIAVLFPK